MRRTLSAILAIARLDAAEVLRSRWLFLCIGVHAAVILVFVLVGMRESSIFGFTGTGRVLVSVTHALLVLLPLLALTATGQSINRSRDDGGLELLLSQPVSRGAYFTAVSVVRAAALILPFAALLLAASVYGMAVQGQAVPWSFVGRCLAVGSALLWAFTGLGLLISTLVRSQAKALMYLLLAWVLGAALLDFGLISLMLQWRLDPRAVFALASLNPVQAARLALLSAAEPELASLGPVGFWMANRLGPERLLAVGLAWPLLVGGASWLVALDAFRRKDVV
jgi:ABC-2 type transport system permease protein